MGSNTRHSSFSPALANFSITNYFNSFRAKPAKPFALEGSSSMNDCFRFMLKDNIRKNRIKAAQLEQSKPRFLGLAHLIFGR